MSDSLMIEATGDDSDRLKATLEICPLQRITGVVWENNSLILKHEFDSLNPSRMTFPPALMVDVISDWLGRTKTSRPNYLYAAPEWPKQPDVDGDVKRGWRVIADIHQIEVHPLWMIYRK